MLGLVFTISSISLPCSAMMTSSYMSAVRNFPVMLTTATSLLLWASIDDVIITNSNATVGDVESFFWDPPIYCRPYTHDHPLAVPPSFSLRNIIRFSEFSFYFSLMFATFIGANVPFACSWFSYFSTSTCLSFLNFLSPFIIEYCIISYCNICACAQSPTPGWCLDFIGLRFYIHRSVGDMIWGWCTSSSGISSSDILLMSSS